GDAETFGRLDRASGDRRDDGVAKAEARRFGEAGLEARDLAEFAGQARLAEGDEVRWQRAPAVARGDREEDREVGRGLRQADAARDVDEDVLVEHERVAVAIEHREEHRQAVRIGADAVPPRVAATRPREQGLELEQPQPRPLPTDGDALTGTGI